MAITERLQGGISLRGARPDDATVYVDGINATDFSNVSSGSQNIRQAAGERTPVEFAPFSIEQLDVVTGGADASFGDAPAVILDRTAFYPESGGQMGDRGTLGGEAVLDVQVDDAGVVRHLLAVSPGGVPALAPGAFTCQPGGDEARIVRELLFPPGTAPPKSARWALVGDTLAVVAPVEDRGKVRLMYRTTPRGGIWDATMADFRHGYSGTTAPLVVKNTVLVGVAGAGSSTLFTALTLGPMSLVAPIAGSFPALAMVLAASGLAVTQEEIGTQVFTPGRAGTLQTDILAGARRIVDGEVPFREFITVRPPGTYWLHAALVALFVGLFALAGQAHAQSANNGPELRAVGNGGTDRRGGAVHRPLDQHIEGIQQTVRASRRAIRQVREDVANARQRLKDLRSQALATAERARTVVPARYQLTGDPFPQLQVGALSCGTFTVNGVEEGSGSVAYARIPVQSPDGSAGLARGSSMFRS